MQNGENGIVRRALRFSGRVQGVGFRWRAGNAANTLGVTGWVRNDFDGAVSMELQGTAEQIDGVILAVERGAYVQIENMYVKNLPLIEDEYGFTVKDDE
jgi:acylphosphatase